MLGYVGENHIRGYGRCLLQPGFTKLALDVVRNRNLSAVRLDRYIARGLFGNENRKIICFC